MPAPASAAQALLARAASARASGDWGAAEQALRDLLGEQPAHAPALSRLIELLLVLGRLSEARTLVESARTLHPGLPVFTAQLGDVFSALGDPETALAAYQLAAETPGTQADLAALAFALHLSYLPDAPVEDFLAAVATWARRHAPPAAPPLAAPPPPGRRLRVGYYSPDLRRHSITHFFLPLLRAHDRDRFELFVYDDTPAPDHLSALLRRTATHWRELRPLDEAAAIRRIREDSLDLLVDLAGLFGAVRPRILAARPAPRQAHLLGFHGSTGLASLDHRFSDPICDPPTCSAPSAETILRIDPGFHCFDPLHEPIAEAPPPCLAGAPFTFGSFNNLNKLNSEVLALWARVLATVPGSRLLLKAPALGDSAARSLLLARASLAGLPAERLLLLPFEHAPSAHLATYHRVDLALDPFPCNGTTTTCEALWMGVPVITLLGDRPSARVSASILHQIGHPELVATDSADYVRRAAALASDHVRLSLLRSTLRARLSRSPLGDPPAYARRIEAAYHQIICSPCPSHAP